MKDPKTTISLRIPKTLQDAIRRRAENNYRTISGEVEILLRDGLASADKATKAKVAR